MAKIVLYKFDRLISNLTRLGLLCGGMIIHSLTSLTIRSYYGDIWGYISFLLPGVAETYLIIVQLGDKMYNYSILVATFVTTALLVSMALFFKNIFRVKIESSLNRRNSQSRF